MATTVKARPEGDMSWKEVGELGLRYGRIPAALLLVEAFYWFLTLPSDTLAPIQVTEAWIWNELTNLIYGEGSAVISHHNGWLTRIDLQHPSFPGPFNTVGLYVSDECAGVHEMIFLSMLVMMTDGVPQRQKIRTIIVMCGLVYILNILRLLVFYPIAVNDCVDLQGQQACLNSMWEYHQRVYEWGFLVVLVLMWLVWFIRIGGPERTLDATKNDSSPWRFERRRQWGRQHWLVLGIAGLMFLLAMNSIYSDEEALAARDTMELCEYASLLSAQCSQAQQRWDDAIGYAWSLSALGLAFMVGTSVIVARPNEDGTWPSESRNTPEVEESVPVVKGHHTKTKGSWKKGQAKEEE